MILEGECLIGQYQNVVFAHVRRLTCDGMVQ